MMSNNTPNRPQINDVGAMPIADIIQLPAEHLALLQEDASANLEAAKRLKDWIDGAITHRYAERAINARRTEHKDTGTIRFLDDTVTVVADLPKKIDWDQALIAEVIERIRAGGDDPAEFVEISFKVPERKYTAWPESIRATFAPARTVKTGKQTFRLTINNEGR
jgi:hypothetical protein